MSKDTNVVCLQLCTPARDESGEEPGTVKKFVIDTKALPDTDIKLSLHDMDFFDAIRMGQSAEYEFGCRDGAIPEGKGGPPKST